MSLQVWLPLCGNIENYGLADITFVNNSATVVNGGKIGQCYSFDGTDDRIYATNVSLPASNISLSLWFFKDTTATTEGYLCSLNNNAGYADCTIGLDTDYASGKITYCAGGNSTLQLSYSKGQWNHVVITYDGTKIVGYLNGIKNGETACTTTLARTNLTIGARSNNAAGAGSAIAYPFKGKINDVRIYDHCLSQAEVYKISKAKLIHLKLDNGGFGQENIAHNSQGIWVSNLGSADGSRAEYQFKTLGQAFPVTNGTKVTVSFDVHMEIKTARNANTRKLLVYNTNRKGPHYSWVYKDLWYSQAFAVGDIIDEHISFVTTVNEKTDSTLSDDFIEFYSEYGTNNWYSISNLHIEVGEVETPWAPNSTDTFYTSSQLGTQFDCSGYQHNAITNSITHSSNTARHICSSVFNGSSSYIKVNDTTWMADRMPAITLNLWAKSATWNANTHFFSCTEGGGFNTESGNTGYLRFPVHVYTSATEASVTYKFDSNEIKLADLPTNEWVMLTWVYDNFGTRTYINGELHHTYLNNSYGIHFNTGARLFLGCEANAANPSSPYFNGQMSDFRIYATAMSQADIRLLYRTSGFVDDQGNVFAGELREV